MAKNAFSKRLRQLRAEKGVDQRKMSIALGHTNNYIFNIEEGYCYPSMTNFFAICEYLDITPSDFLHFDEKIHGKEEELLETVRGWCHEDLDHLIDYAKKMKW